jgi:predicted O-methyltransferase YrrM
MGHPSRLNRNLSNSYDTPEYSLEDLIAWTNGATATRCDHQTTIRLASLRGILYCFYNFCERGVASAVTGRVAEAVSWPGSCRSCCEAIGRKLARAGNEMLVPIKPIYHGQVPTFGDFDREALRLLLDEVGTDRPTIVEIGSWLGTGSTQVLMDFVRKRGGQLHCIDTWEGSPGIASHAKIASDYDVYETFRQNVRTAGGEDVVTAHCLTSIGAAADWPDATIDMVFIDADHRFAAVQQDLAAWLPKLRPGGIMAGHDCECRVTTANRSRLDQGKDQDNITCEPPFLVWHAGVIVAVDAAFSGRARLWAERSVVLPDGRRGPATIWDITV